MSFNNFNFSNKPEYDLNDSLAKEMIRLYGILVKFIKTERINTDKSIFGDYSHLKATEDVGIHEFYAIPEDSENWDDGGYNLTAFGPINFQNISLYIHRSSIINIGEIQTLTGNLLIFPNNKIMEITDTEPLVPGINNLFTHKDTKSILKLTCKPHDTKLINEVSTDSLFYGDLEERGEYEDSSYTEESPYESLDKYFTELEQDRNELQQEVEVTPSTDKVIKGDKVELDKKEKEPIIASKGDDIWGQF